MVNHSKNNVINIKETCLDNSGEAKQSIDVGKTTGEEAHEYKTPPTVISL